MATRLSRAVSIALAAVLTTVAVPALRAQQVGGAKIAPHDVLNVAVFGDQTYSGKFVVDSDGTIDYQTLGRVKAEGFTAREVADTITDMLVKGGILTKPQVTVELVQSTNKHVNIVGEVRSPAIYGFGGDLSLLQALAMAGSLTESAADEAFLYHKDSTEPVTVDLYEILHGGSSKYNITLADGDTLNIPKVRPVFVQGQVRNPGPIVAPRGTTVQQAITMAGGVTDKGKESGVKIDRLVNGKKTTIGVKDNKTTIVQPGDTITVPARIL
jgi:polysaccharide export outer membrane protein